MYLIIFLLVLCLKSAKQAPSNPECTSDHTLGGEFMLGGLYSWGSLYLYQTVKIFNDDINITWACHPFFAEPHSFIYKLSVLFYFP